MDLCRTSLEQVTKQCRISRADALLLLQYPCHGGDGVWAVVSGISVVLHLRLSSFGKLDTFFFFLRAFSFVLRDEFLLSDRLLSVQIHKCYSGKTKSCTCRTAGFQHWQCCYGGLQV